jgi:DNA-binding beta-propeller fold protein YncE
MTGIRFLRTPTDRTTISPSTLTAPSRSRRRRCGTLVVLLALVAGACGGPATPAAVPDEAGAPLSTGGTPTGLAVHDDALLVLHDDGSIVRVTADGQLAPFTDRSDQLTASLVAFGSLWAARTGTGTTAEPQDLEPDEGWVEYSLDGIVRIDLDDGATQATIDDVGTDLVLAATDDAVWLAGEHAGEQGWVWRIDPDTDHATVVQAGDGVRGDLAVRTSVLLAVDDQLWLVGNCDAMPCPAGAERVRVLDPSSGEVTTLDVALPDDLLLSSAVAVDGRLWFAGISLNGELDGPEGLLVAFEPTGELVHRIEVGRLPLGLTATPSGLWLTDCLAGTLTRVDPARGEVLEPPIVVGDAYPDDGVFDWYRDDYACPGAVAQTSDTIWVALVHDGTLVPVR